MRDMGLEYSPPKKYAKVDPARAQRIAHEYERMADDPAHPLVKASYEAMINETMAQYQVAKKHGFVAEFWDPEKERDPYEASPRLAIEDVNKNNHMYVFPTYFGYGSKEIPEEERAKNPLLADSGERWNGYPVTVNDVFRAVHDYYGHAKEGVGFRHDGEENAWRSHASMYSPLARLAMTSETRGQNSWLNFGPHGEHNKKARTEDTVFADQKIGVMAPWTAHEGAEDFMSPEDILKIEHAYKGHKYARGGRLIQDKYPTHYMPNVGRQVMRSGGGPERSLEEYQDPESKRMAGWDWTPLPEVHKSLGSFTEIPSHVAAFGNFMNETAKKAATTGLTPRDLIKAYLITRASIQRGDLTPEKIMENWPDFPGPKDRLIRPEGAMGEWLQTPMGQKYLDAAVKGNVHQGAVQDAVRAMSSFGMTNKGEAQALPYAAKMLPGQEKLVSDMVARAIHSDSAPQEWRDWATKLHGIKYAKSGFLASMLGRGDQPTADTRQYNVHSGTSPGKERNKLIDKAQVDSVLRLAARQRALNIGMPSELTPHYQHLVHHTVWDKSADAVTTHEDLMNAMRHAASGGEINDPPIHQHIVAHAMRAAGIEGLDQHKMANGGDPGSDPMVQKAMRVADKYKNGGRSASPEQVELQRRMKLLLHPEHEDPEVVQQYLKAREAWSVPTHERGAYSARVLPMPAHKVSPTVAPMGNVTPKEAEQLSWNAFYKIGKGGTIFTLGGDRSNLGRLTHINGKPLAWPVDLHAGTKYMAEPNPGAVWANAKGAASALRKNIQEAAKYGPVYGAFAPMSPKSVDSSVNMFDVLMSQVPSSGISKKDAKAFDDSLKAGAHIKGTDEDSIRKRKKIKEIMQNWPGILNAEKARDFATTLSGAHRGAIVKHMEAAPWQNAGFPSVGITRAAITDPELISTAGNMMGHHVVELDPSAYKRENLLFEHSTYGYPTKGKLIGKLPFVERHVAMPDYVERSVMDPAVIKKTGEPLIIHPYSPNPSGRNSWSGNTELRQAVQPINERMLESIQQAHGSDFADGGDVGFNPQPIRQAKPARKPTQTPDAILRALALSRSITKGT
jgi:hypothetical protein